MFSLLIDRVCIQRLVRVRPLFLVTAFTCFSTFGLSQAQPAQDQLKAGFQHPPTSARPRVWWHWMNGNIAKEGIKLDLEWMHRVGIAGYQNFDAALQTPQVVDKRLAYMTPEWKEAFKYAIKLGDQLGMEMAIAGSPGWSETGGPWVPAAHGMKKYVWSESLVDGGRPFTGKLRILQRRLAHFKTSEYASSLTGPHRTYRNFMQMLSL